MVPDQLDSGELAGLALIQNERAHYVIAVERGPAGNSVVVLQRTSADSPLAGQELRRQPLPAATGPVSLRLQLEGPRLNLYYATAADQWLPLADNLDASLLSAAVAGGFIGNTFGPYALRR